MQGDHLQYIAQNLSFLLNFFQLFPIIPKINHLNHLNFHHLIRFFTEKTIFFQRKVFNIIIGGYIIIIEVKFITISCRSCIRHKCRIYSILTRIRVCLLINDLISIRTSGFGMFNRMSNRAFGLFTFGRSWEALNRYIFLN